MKNWKDIMVLALALCLLTACGSGTAPTEDAEPWDTPEPVADARPSGEDGTADSGEPSLAEDEEPTRLLCRIVDGAEDGSLLLAALDGGADSVYRLPAAGLTVTLDGQSADASVLEDGMPVEVACNGLILESFPAGFGEVYSVAAWSRGQERNPMGTAYDLCGLYLQVLDDLWEKDPGLNENITQIAVDLSNAPGGLSEGEKAAVIWRFGEKHGVEAFAATFGELEEQGTLTAEPLGPDAPDGAAFYYWEDGCLFSITPNEDHAGEIYSLPVVFFHAEKWRSSLGAYFFYDCSAGWGQNTSWSDYEIGSEMIS